MPLLGIDLGTAHCKAAIFEENGRLIGLAARSIAAHQDPAGFSYYSPDEVWRTVCEVVQEVLGGLSGQAIEALGISSMAETGLLLEVQSGKPLCPLLPWFDPAATPQAEQLASMGDPYSRFIRAGITPSFKCALAKLLWLRERGQALHPGLVWLSTADWLGFRLTGKAFTDPSLAGRTYAFRLDQKQWDAEKLQELGLPGDLFPPVRPSGAIAGKLSRSASLETGLPEGLPVAIAGHDHICAAFASRAIYPGEAFDSMGTAEALTGPLDERLLTRADYDSGLSFVYHVAPGRMYWMGGLSTSGGSLEWLRGIFGNPPLTYADLESMQEAMDSRPGDLMFFPYLAGSGSPHTDLYVRGSFIGLTAAHHQIDLLKAVFEGTAYEMEFIRRAGERVLGVPLRTILAAGGGTRNQRWLQITSGYNRLPVSGLADARGHPGRSSLVGRHRTRHLSQPWRGPQNLAQIQPSTP